MGASQADPWSQAAEVVPGLPSDAGRSCVCVRVAFDKSQVEGRAATALGMCGGAIANSFRYRVWDNSSYDKGALGCGRSALAGVEGRYVRVLQGCSNVRLGTTSRTCDSSEN